MPNSLFLARLFSKSLLRSPLCLGSRFRSSLSGGSHVNGIPMSEPLPWLPPPVFATNVSKEQQETRVTVLENGLQVASQMKFGEFCSVGVLIDSGSRYEVHHPSGTNHFLEKLAFSSTSSFKNRDAILQALEKHGGICDASTSRDTLIYAISVMANGLATAVDVLSDVVLQPKITTEEIENCRTTIGFELEMLEKAPNPEPLLVEMIHAAAFRDNTLGLPKICPQESLGSVDRKSMMSYLYNYHTPERMVLAGVGVEHDDLVALAKSSFSKTPTWMDSDREAYKEKGRDLSIAQYTGGMVQVTKDLSDVSPGLNSMPELAHFVVGLESCSHKDPDFVAFCVLNMIMGGGSSFSAGGPGKGMYTRLFINVLNKFPWMNSAVAYNYAYKDSGLFSIQASSHPADLKNLVEVILKELVQCHQDISDVELNRAKKQLQSMMLMNLETRPVILEDVGRQVLSNGIRLSPQHYYDLIEKITRDDVVRVAERMLRSKPAVAALGNLSELPSYEHIQAAIGRNNGRWPRRLFTLRP